MQGAINFAITNSVGSYLLAIGIALLYARTGALNLAQIGQTLAHGKAGGLVIVAMTLLLCALPREARSAVPSLGRRDAAQSRPPRCAPCSAA